MDEHIRYRRSAVSDRQIDTLIGLCKGLLADGKVTQDEAEFLHQWLTVNAATINDNPVILPLFEKVNAMLADSVLDDEEAAELLDTLRRFSNNEGLADGELLRTTGLPLNEPQPAIRFQDRTFVFTGTFAFGRNRRDCVVATERLGGTCISNIRKSVDYLVLGHYVTPSWKHESWGTKIEKALEYRDNRGLPLAIVSEEHWRTQGGFSANA